VATDKDKFLADLVALHGVTLEKFLTRKLENPEDAAEIAQDAFLRIQSMAEPQQLDNARAFLFQVASNLAIDKLRRRTLHYRYLKAEKNMSADGEPVDINAIAASPEQILHARQKLDAIYAAVDELPFKVKQAFLLHRKSGLSYGDIAREMGVSVSSIEKYILQALKHCRARLAAFYDEGGPKPGN